MAARTTTSAPSPASTAILVRDTRSAGGETQIETLLLLRNHRLVFAGGAWVFPGGKIETEDYPSMRARDASGLSSWQRCHEAARNAVVRETYEETGLIISASNLIHIAHWTTPPGYPRRYATWFFLSPLTAVAEVKVDNHEIVDHQWVTPRDALHSHSLGQLRLSEPTVHTLRSISRYSTVVTLCQAMHDSEVHVFPEGSEHYKAASDTRSCR